MIIGTINKRGSLMNIRCPFCSESLTDEDYNNGECSACGGDLFCDDCGDIFDECVCDEYDE
jgi:hypothetical protein